MAQRFITNNGVILYEPGTIVHTEVKATVTGNPLLGIVTLIGEADEGPSFKEENDLDSNAFSPDEVARVIEKYKSGRLVDAFVNILNASADARINGTINLVKLVKTNTSISANELLPRIGIDNYAKLLALRAGASGNLIRVNSQAAALEIPPSTPMLAYTAHFNATGQVFSLHCNGSNAHAVTIPDNEADLSAIINNMENIDDGIAVQGGKMYYPFTSASNETLNITELSSNTIRLSISNATYFSEIEVGDSVFITPSSLIATTDPAFIASYIVTAVDSTSVTLKVINKYNTDQFYTISIQSFSGSNNAEIFYKPIIIKNITGQPRQLLSDPSDWSSIHDSDQKTFVLTSSVNFNAIPRIGDYLKFTSNFAGINKGLYVIINTSANSITATKISSGISGSNGTETAALPGFIVLRPVIDGLAKSLEIAGNDFATCFKLQDTTNPPFVNTAILSSQEYQNAFSITKENLTETFTVGGEIVLKAGSSKPNTVLEILNDKIILKDGVITVFTASFKNVNTLNDLVALINSANGFYASLTKPKYGVLPLTVLDKGIYKLASSINFTPALIKKDASEWIDEINSSKFIKYDIAPLSGLPEPIDQELFLKNGAKGGTVMADIVDAFEAMELVDTNFIVPLFSVDATKDILNDETEPTSTYTISAINTLAQSHVYKMSTEKAKKNRIAMISYDDTFEKQKLEANNFATSYRTAMFINRVNLVSAQGEIKTYQPFMAAVLAAGMQAAAGARGIVKRFVNVNGVSHAGNDFDARLLSDREEALKSGLMAIESVRAGGYRWISDQTTYQIDDNFVFNSIQAVYVSDLITLRLIDVFDANIVGESLADISAQYARSLVEAEMDTLFRLGWIAPSDDAPAGYKDLVIKINGRVMSINLEIKLAGLLYFVPISLFISEVNQTA